MLILRNNNASAAEECNSNVSHWEKKELSVECNIFTATMIQSWQPHISDFYSTISGT